MGIVKYIVLVMCLVLSFAACNGVDNSTQRGSTPMSSPELSPNSISVTKISWKAVCITDFFDLYIVVNGEDYFVGNFFGANMDMLWEYKRPDVPEYILSFFRGIWTGAGSDFYIKRKSDTELVVMYHIIEYRSNPEELNLDNYDEMLIIPIEKGSEIQIEKSIILKGINPNQPETVG